MSANLQQVKQYYNDMKEKDRDLIEFGGMPQNAYKMLEALHSIYPTGLPANISFYFNYKPSRDDTKDKLQYLNDMIQKFAPIERVDSTRHLFSALGGTYKPEDVLKIATTFTEKTRTSEINEILAAISADDIILLEKTLKIIKTKTGVPIGSLRQLVRSVRKQERNRAMFAAEMEIINEEEKRRVENIVYNFFKEEEMHDFEGRCLIPVMIIAEFVAGQLYEHGFVFFGDKDTHVARITYRFCEPEYYNDALALLLYFLAVFYRVESASTVGATASLIWKKFRSLYYIRDAIDFNKPEHWHLIKVKNGVLIANDFRHPFVPNAEIDKDIRIPDDYLTNIMIPWEYNEHVTPPSAIREFMNEMCKTHAGSEKGDPERMRDMLEWAGYTMIAANPLKKIKILFGPSNTGKNTMIDVLVALLGRNNCADVSLNDICDARNSGVFASADFKNKLMIYSNEMGMRLEKQQVETLKDLSGNKRTINIEEKYHARKAYNATYKFTFGTNDLPDIGTYDDSIDNRVTITEMSRIFPKDNRNEFDINALIMNPSEMEGFLILAFHYLQRLLKRGYYQESCNEQKQLWVESINPLAQFIRERCIIDKSDDDCYVEKSELYNIYCEWCKDKEIEPIQEKNLVDEMQRQFVIPVKKKRVGEVITRGSNIGRKKAKSVYVNLRLRDAGQDSIDNDIIEEDIEDESWKNEITVIKYEPGVDGEKIKDHMMAILIDRGLLGLDDMHAEHEKRYGKIDKNMYEKIWREWRTENQ